MAGVEVEGVETRGANFPKVVVARVLSREQHPNADRLGVCRVDDGTHADPPRQIVCGATNFKVGDKVPLALPGAVLPGDVTIKVGKLRGVESEGMLCSAKELRLADDAAGLLILPADAPVGAPIGSLFPSDTIFDLEITPTAATCSATSDWRARWRLSPARRLRNPVDAMETPVGGDPVAHLPVIIAANAREACPFYTARFLDGVRVGSQPRLAAFQAGSGRRAFDQQRGGRDEFRHARTRAAAPRVRRGNHRRGGSRACAWPAPARNCSLSMAAPTSSSRTISSSPGWTARPRAWPGSWAARRAA